MSSTLAPASSSSALSLSASSRSMPSLIGLGGLVDQRLGLLEPEAGGRTHDLDHLDLLVAGPGEDHVEGASAPRPRRRRRRPRQAQRPARAPRPAAADTPKASSSALIRSESSSTEMLLSSSIQSWVVVAIDSSFPRAASAPGSVSGCSAAFSLGFFSFSGSDGRLRLGSAQGGLRWAASGSGSRFASASPQPLARARQAASGLRCRGRFPAHQSLLGDLSELDGQPRDQCIQRPDEAGQRRGDRADELTVQHLACGEAGDRADLVGGRSQRRPSGRP